MTSLTSFASLTRVTVGNIRSLSTSSALNHKRIRDYPKPARKPKIADPLLASKNAKTFQVTSEQQEENGDDSGMTFFVRPPPTMTPPTLPIEFNRKNLPDTSTQTNHVHPLLSKTSFNESVPSTTEFINPNSSDLSNPSAPYAHLAPQFRSKNAKYAQSIKSTPSNLSQEQIQEMIQLRRSNPSYWTAKKLAKKFDCSTYCVRVVSCGLGSEARALRKQLKEINQERQEKYMNTWTEKKHVAHQIRQARRELW